MCVTCRVDVAAHRLLRRFDFMSGAHRPVFDCVPHLYASLVTELGRLYECSRPGGRGQALLTEVLARLLLHSETALFASGAPAIRLAVSCLPGKLGRLVDVRVASLLRADVS